MSGTDLKELVSLVQFELPKLERKKPTESKEVHVRDLRKEVERDQATDTVFAGLALMQKRLRDFRVVMADGRKTFEVEGKVIDLEATITQLVERIAKTKAGIKADTGLYTQWMAGPLSTEDELAVSLDLAERGVLSEVSMEDAAKLRTARQEYKQLVEMGKGEESDLRRPPRTFTVREITGSNSSRQRYFIKRWYPQGEQWPEGLLVLQKAYEGHFNQKQEHYRQMDRLAGEMLGELGVWNAEITVGKDGQGHEKKFGKLVTDPDAPNNQKMALQRLADGVAGVYAFEVMASHAWLGKDKRPLAGTVVVKCHGTEDGVAKLELLGAASSIYPSLRRHIEAEQVFAYKAGRAFEGMSKASGEDQGWLRFLLLKVSGLNGQRRGTSGVNDRFNPQLPRGQRKEPDPGPTRAKGRREKGGKGGGKSRTHYARGEEE